MPKRGEKLDFQVRYSTEDGSVPGGKRSHGGLFQAARSFKMAVRARQGHPGQSRVLLFRKSDSTLLARWDGSNATEQLTVTSELRHLLGSLGVGDYLDDLPAPGEDEPQHAVMHARQDPAEPATVFSISADRRIHQYDPAQPCSGWQQIAAPEPPREPQEATRTQARHPHQHEQAAAQAADFLVHYMSTAWRAAGLSWDLDHDAEIRIIVDKIVEAARHA